MSEKKSDWPQKAVEQVTIIDLETQIEFKH
jgi:hypothetical protein